MNGSEVIDEPVLPASEDCQRQINRILQSAVFRNASTLQQLLQFLTARAFEHGAESLKEYTIGVEAFGRSHEFDPKTDTIVRVQIHRLRQKLKEYYDTDGVRDPIFVEIPKGHYIPRFEVLIAPHDGSDTEALRGQKITRSETTGLLSPNQDGSSREAGREIERASKARSQYVMILVATAVLVFGLGFLAGKEQIFGKRVTDDSSDSARRSANSGDSVEMFWSNIIRDDPTPVIAYPDAVFLLDNSNDLFRFRQGASDDRGALVDSHLARQFASSPNLVSGAGALYYENGYTGAGELQAVAMLSSLFGQMGIRPIVKPSRDVTPDDLRQHCVILLGSSFQNVAVAQFMSPGDFRFKNPDSRLEQWRAQIDNSQPKPGEESSYRTERDPVTHVLKADYAVISVQQGVVPGRSIVVLGGLDTTGTEGATLFATSKMNIEELERNLGMAVHVGGKQDVPLFQALVHVHLEKGYDVLGASLVAVHTVKPSRPAGSNTEASPSTPQ